MRSFRTAGKTLPPGPLSNGEGERVPLAFSDKDAKGEVTPSLLERGLGGEVLTKI